MDREHIDSSRIESAGYDTDSSLLEVEYKNGEVWKYYDVPEQLWKAFITADSKGKFFHDKVKYRYLGSSQ